MKNLLTLLAVVIGITAGSQFAYAGGEIKEVCKDKLDKKGQVVKDKKGEVVQECKKIKVHKKVEGEKVPDGKK